MEFKYLFVGKVKDLLEDIQRELWDMYGNDLRDGE